MTEIYSFKYNLKIKLNKKKLVQESNYKYTK